MTCVPNEIFAFPSVIKLEHVRPNISFGTLVGSSGLEPPTSRLSGVRSNLLSYEPIHFREVLPFSFALPFRVVEMNGFEPMTPCLQSRCSPS